MRKLEDLAQLLMLEAPDGLGAIEKDGSVTTTGGLEIERIREGIVRVRRDIPFRVDVQAKEGAAAEVHEIDACTKEIRTYTIQSPSDPTDSPLEILVYKAP